MVKEFSLFTEIACAANELEGVLIPKEFLRALFILIRLAKNLSRIDLQICISRPSAVADVTLHEVPVPAIVTRVVSFSAAFFSQARTVVIAVPKEVVRIWVEVEYGYSEGIRDERSFEGIPFLPAVRCVEVLFAVGEEVCAVAGVAVVVEHEESFVRLDLCPSVSLVARLPDRVIGETDKDSLKQS